MPDWTVNRSLAAARSAWRSCWKDGWARYGQHREVTYERITTDPDVMGGVPCIRGLRFPVATVVAMVADGMTTDEILAEHPGLAREDVHEALLYAAEAVRDRELPLRHTA